MGNKDNKQSIIVSALIIVDNKVFIAKRAETKRFFPGCWEMPAGGVEFGEDPEEALKREIREEIDCDIEILKPIYIFSYVVENIHDLEIVYLTKIKENQEPKINPSDHSEFLWATFEEAKKLLEKGCPGEAEALKFWQDNKCNGK